MTPHSASAASRPALRSPRRSDAPTISVVVASNRERALLNTCLASLIPQCDRASAQLIVARCGDPAEITALGKAFPGVRFLGAPQATPIPQLRGLGMADATGDIVALTEDHCVADEHWVETMLQNAQDSADVIGGGMGNAQRDRTVDWAAYFAEYGFFSNTRPKRLSGERPLLTGANVAYKRHVVSEVIEWAKQGEWENVAHSRLLAQGSAMRFIGSAAVYQNKNYQFGEFCVDRYEHGRDFARKRLVEDPSSSRWSLLLVSPLLPPLLTWRVAVAAGPARWSTFLRALPTTFAFLTAWSIGEAVGYLRGPAPVTATEPAA